MSVGSGGLRAFSNCNFREQSNLLQATMLRKIWPGRENPQEIRSDGNYASNYRRQNDVLERMRLCLIDRKRFFGFSVNISLKSSRLTSRSCGVWRSEYNFFLFLDWNLSFNREYKISASVSVIEQFCFDFAVPSRRENGKVSRSRCCFDSFIEQRCSEVSGELCS